MRYFSIFRPDPTAVGGPPSPEHMDRMNKLVEDSTREGTLVTAGAWLPLNHGGIRVRRSGDTVTVVDGPYVESKELVGGFAILEARSREHAIELCRQFLAVAGDGETVVHQLMEPPPMPAN